jgi:hypothetical protein
MPRTLKEICTTAYEIQDACNFYPVVMELGKVVADLKANGIEHQNLKDHPATIILVDKINDMMGRPDFETICVSFKFCRETAYEGVIKK